MGYKQLRNIKFLAFLKTTHLLIAKYYGLQYVSVGLNSISVMPCSLFNIFVGGGGTKVEGPNFIVCYRAICLPCHASSHQGQTSALHLFFSYVL